MCGITVPHVPYDCTPSRAHRCDREKPFPMLPCLLWEKGGPVDL
jgi:hypothetical protein